MRSGSSSAHSGPSPGKGSSGSSSPGSWPTTTRSLTGPFLLHFRTSGSWPGLWGETPRTPPADRPLPPPLQDCRLVARPLGVDPVDRASFRNRAVYASLLVLFYAVL